MINIFRKHSRIDNNSTHYGAKLITIADPKNMISEQFRTIRTNISFMGIDHPIKTLAFTSANMSEGKSTVTDNVVVVWANSGKNVLLIDADLRRPTLHKAFNKSNQAGLTTILTTSQTTVDMSKMIQPSGVQNLSIITAGPIPPNPAELLNSKRMSSLLDAVSDVYDVVILDVPPILEVSDTQALINKLDGVVMVVKAGQTQKAAAQRAVQLIKMSKTRILGYVINDVNRDGDAAYGYGYGYSSDEK